MSDTINNDSNLRILNSILDGYSKYDFNGSCVYVKHPLQSEINNIYLNYKDSCTNYESLGIMSEKEQISFICENGWWSQEKEQEILYLQKSLERLNNTKLKLIYKSDKDRISEQIEDVQKKILLSNRQKSEYMQVTSEYLASKDSVSFFAKNFVYKDNEFKNKFIEEEENEIDEIELDLIYYTYTNQFSIKNIKNISISIVFQNMLYTAPECSSLEVFGLPVVKLTKNQIELLTWGSYYKKLIKNSQKEIPDELYNDADKFIEWYESVNKVKINKKSSKRSSYKKSKYGSESKFLFGDRDEIKQIQGGEISGDKILRDAQKSGGKLDFYDLMEK